MTIKELENRTGMTRANIRFYEGEGLLSPKRLDNGYRDYSEEDARTLEKIKLLRQIGVDIDTIRKVQNGTLALEQALFSQHNKLEGDKAMLERAAEVCRELELSGVEYDALDPAPYLRQLEAPSRPVLPNPPPPTPKEEAEQDDTPQACYHPWQRWLARMLDMTLYDTVFNVLWLVLLHDQSLIRLQMGSAVAQWVLALVLLAFTLAVEPLWLHFWGWTPGKWLFGLKLRNKDGEKLSLAQAWARSKALAWEGYGWNLPGYSLYRFWKCRQDALDGWNGSWNGEAGCRYTKEGRRFSGWIFVGVNVLCSAALFAGIRYSSLPPCRGDLTVAEFAQNYNYFQKQLSQDAVKGPWMEDDGRWAGPTDEYQQGGTTRVKVDGVWVAVEDPVWDEPEFTVEDGRVTSVTIRVTGGCIDALPFSNQEMLAVLALSGATGDWSMLHSDTEGWLTAANEVLGQFGDGETQARGLRVVKQEELSGYQETEIVWLLTPVVGEEQHYERVVTISLMD